MNKHTILICIFAVLTCSLPAPALRAETVIAAEERLTLSKCITIAVERHPDILAAT